MSDAHPQLKDWLLEERATHLRFGRHDKVTLVDAELAKLGHRVKGAEKPAPAPVEPLETTAADPLPEDTVEPKAPPKRRGRPPKPRDDQGNIVREEPSDG